MKVGFSGAGGTGKSVTLNLVSPQLKLPVLKSTNREVFKRHNISEIDQESMTATQRWELQQEIFANRIHAEGKYSTSGFISDRTILDNYVYSLVRCYLAMTNEDLDRIEKIVSKNTKEYSAIFFFPMGGFDLEDDGLRQNNKTLGRLIEQTIRGTLLSGIIDKERVHMVPSGTPEYRAEFIINKLRELDGDLFL